MTAVVTALILAGTADAAVNATLTRSESALLAVMNQARTAHGLRPLRADGRLEVAARRHSRRMLRTGTFAHGAFTARIRRTGVRAPRVGENLAWSSGALAQARVIVQMWLASPSHRANLLRPGYRMVGVGAITGCFNGQRHTLMVTTDFAGR
ncbi:MAG: CAP domain-containing protein [Gaiellaceae bacterium]